ncbi:MAG: SpoVG family protein [Candidatus Faecousia sp.]|nr:SpoVG family protein [Candidatus Faecousia sp.]
MKIKARIDRMVNTGNVKAIASVSLDGMFVVKNLKVMDGKKGLFVSMPQETYPGKDGQKKYSNTFFALTNSAKLALQESVLQAYQQQIDPSYVPRQDYGGQSYPQEIQHQRDYYPQPQYPEPQYPDWVNECDDGMLPMEMCGM